MRALTRAIKPEQRLIVVGAISLLQYDETSLRREHQDSRLAEHVYYPIIDHSANWTLLQHNPCDWTLVCPPLIVDGPPSDDYSTCSDYWPAGAAHKIAVGVVGRFIANEIDQRAFTRVRVGSGAA